MTLIEFVKYFHNRYPNTKIDFKWFWIEEDGTKEDEEYSFLGNSEEFLEKYYDPGDYDCLEDVTLAELGVFKVDKLRSDVKIVAELYR